MRITRLQIRNFRSIQSLDMEVPQVCALVGPNNAGKSNLLLALHRILGRDYVYVSAFTNDDVYGRKPDVDMSIAVTLDPPLQFKRFAAADPADIGTLSFTYTNYKIGQQKGQRRLEQACLNPKGNPVQVPAQAPKKGVKTPFAPLTGVPPEVREQVPLIYIGTNRSLREQLPSARYSLLRQLMTDIESDLRDPNDTLTVTESDGSTRTVARFDRFEEVIQEALSLLRTASFNELERTIKERALRLLGFDPAVDSDALDFYFAPFDASAFYRNLQLAVREGNFVINATELGEGIQNALVLAILQAFEQRRKQGAVLLIEEPEMFLHPQVQRSLYKTIREIGTTNQVIYTTHSPHFLAVPDYTEVRLIRKAESGTSVRASDLPLDDARKNKFIKELNPERNELFFATRLLLVEGDTEKLALPEYAKRISIDLDQAGATIVEVGGKRNLMEFARLATSFEIPTGILYDEDSSDFEGQRPDEAAYNAELNALDNGDSVRTWCLSSNYEDHLRTAVGEMQYQQLCQKYPKTGKPTRARLIAMEDGLPIPAPIEEVLQWLSQSDPSHSA